jgi:2-keto-4-pentenoate hydratase/2-oxohepta-3-ene-1,7-dioic acid hydratase in catechol pathway
MRLIRFRDNGEEKPGLILPDGEGVDVSGFGEDYNEQFFASGGIGRLKQWIINNLEGVPRLEKDVDLAPAVCRPSKIICVGLNFSDHAAEGGMDVPSEPVLFMKATSSLTGPNDDLIIPLGGEKVDWEVELAVVIGKKATYVTEENAMDYVAGFVLHNDYSERAFQLERNGQWVKGKSCDSFAPLGPYVITVDEVGEIDNLGMWLTVNGHVKQQGNTGNMIFKVPFLVSYISKFMTLLPGDVISTGTPAGVGLGCKPQQFLKEGDVVELGIDKLGSSRQRVKSYKSETHLVKLTATAASL